MLHKPNKPLIGLVFGGFAGFLLSFIGSALGTSVGDPNVALGRGFSIQGTAVEATDATANSGIYNISTGNWERLRGATAGSGTGVAIPVLIDSTNETFIVTSYQVLTTTQQSVSTCAQVPTSPSGNIRRLCIFNEDTATNAFCSHNSSCTVSNGVMIEPRTGRCFPTSDAVYCISDSGTITLDTEQYSN